ncbi:MAG TPA: arsenate reductase ArsC [Flavobacteriales bacterium]|nr:arsenate reductase ArsC [Flavobacteriales bacterium]
MKILVLCTGNSCRSQMAHGYLRSLLGHDVEVFSAGIETHGVDHRAIAVMEEDGIDISHHTSNNVDEYRQIIFDHVITVCDNAREACPFFPAQAMQHHHDFPDPAKAKGSEAEVMSAFRNTRDEIKVYCRQFAAQRA